MTLDNGTATNQWSISTATSSIPLCNQQAYGQPALPFYNLSAITTPLALFSGTQQFRQNVQCLCSRSPFSIGVIFL